MSTYGERLKSLMDEGKEGNPVTVKDLAVVLGTSYQAVRKVVELGGKFGSENNQKVADFFGVNATWLLKEVGEKYGEVKPEFTSQAIDLARLFDQIPERDVVGRAKAHMKATQAILDQIPPASETAQQGSETQLQQSQTAPSSTLQL